MSKMLLSIAVVFLAIKVLWQTEDISLLKTKLKALEKFFLDSLQNEHKIFSNMENRLQELEKSENEKNKKKGKKRGEE